MQAIHHEFSKTIQSTNFMQNATIQTVKVAVVKSTIEFF